MGNPEKRHEHCEVGRNKEKVRPARVPLDREAEFQDHERQVPEKPRERPPGHGLPERRGRVLPDPRPRQPTHLKPADQGGQRLGCIDEVEAAPAAWIQKIRRKLHQGAYTKQRDPAQLVPAPGYPRRHRCRSLTQPHGSRLIGGHPRERCPLGPGVTRIASAGFRPREGCTCASPPPGITTRPMPRSLRREKAFGRAFRN